MNAKPVEAIERMRAWMDKCLAYDTKNERIVLAYLDAIPDGAVCVVWPAELTRERLEELADKIGTRNENAWECWPGQESAIRALAAIAPQKRKRVVNLWQHVADDLPVCRHPKWQPDPALACNWTLIKRNVELED